MQFHNVVRAFKATRLCCPIQVQALHPTAASVQELKQISFITDAEAVQLVEELPNYLDLAIADGAIETEEGKVQWWATHAAALPNWSAAVKKILLVQPRSASAERVFSLLQNAFSKQQEAALEETVETSVMLRYNDNKRTWNLELYVCRRLAGGAKTLTNRDSALYYIRKDVNIERLWF